MNGSTSSGVVFVLRNGWLIACLVLAAGCGSPSRPSVLLVTIDTLRADALGAYGALPSPSPQLDALAKQATLYERAFSPMPMTRPAHFSIFTSRYPREHGVLNNRLSLPEDEETLAEVFQAHGYRTGGFVAVSLLSRGSGVGQGFEVLEKPLERQRSADGVVKSALEWVGSLEPEEAFFAWVHLFDPHQPYEQLDARLGLGEVDPEMLKRYPKLEWSDFYRVAKQNDGDIPAAVFDHALALYRTEVAYADRAVGRLLSGLGAIRDLDEVVVVVTSDHGECFEDGVFFEHSDCLHQAALRVPLFVRYPREFPPGARNDAVVSHIDVAPTLLAAAGLPVPVRFGGLPLQGANASRAARQVLVQHPFFQQAAVEKRLKKRRVIETVAGRPTSSVEVSQEKVGLVSREWKYLRSGASEELYRQPVAVAVGFGSGEADPVRDWAAEDETARSEMSAALDALLERHPLTVLDASEINDELRATLEALGYVQ